MSGEQIYLAARDCARGDLSKDLASPTDWRRKPTLINRLRAAYAARSTAAAGRQTCTAPGQTKTHREM